MASLLHVDRLNRLRVVSVTTGTDILHSVLVGAIGSGVHDTTAHSEAAEKHEGDACAGNLRLCDSRHTQ